MLPDRVSNPGPQTYESCALPIALRGPASVQRTLLYGTSQMHGFGVLLFFFFNLPIFHPFSQNNGINNVQQQPPQLKQVIYLPSQFANHFPHPL